MRDLLEAEKLHDTKQVPTPVNFSISLLKKYHNNQLIAVAPARPLKGGVEVLGEGEE